MKTLILIFAMMLISINLYSAPPDSCLRMICNNDIHYDPDLGQYVGSSNPDSVMIDICIGSNTYNKHFAKRYFILQFHENYYPFDSVMKPYTIHSVSDISSSKHDFKLKLQQLESQYGTIYFQGEIYEELDSNFYRNPGCRLFFADYQDVEDIIANFKANIDTLKDISYQGRYGIPMSIEAYDDKLNSLTLSPNPVKDVIELKVFENNSEDLIHIFNLNCQIVFSNKFKDRINVSSLPSGLYFLKLGYNTYKFIKE